MEKDKIDTKEKTGPAGRTLAAEAASPASQGKTLQLSGWVHRIRDLGGVCFLILRDRSGRIQVVYEENPGYTPESVITVTGTVQANPKAPGGWEVQAHRTELLAPADPELPLAVSQDPAKTGLEAQLDHRLLALRNPQTLSIFRLQASLVQYFAEYLRSRDFTEIKSSKLIGSGTEGGTGLFEVDYFDRKVYLAQSPQFYKQAMVASGLERVFEIGAAYRAEKHDTPRHLNEYVSLDVEMGFIQSEKELMDLEQGILAHIFSQVQANHQDTLDLWGATVPAPEAAAAIPRITYDEGKRLFKERTGKRIFEINPEAERILCDWAQETAGIPAVFVNEFPRKKRPFYTYPQGKKTMSFDLLFRGLEITTGGRRIHDYAMLKETLPAFKLTEEGLGGYTEIFKYGCPPHGGFAIGLERLTQKILGLENIKQASLFPRDRRRVAP